MQSISRLHSLTMSLCQADFVFLPWFSSIATIRAFRFVWIASIWCRRQLKSENHSTVRDPLSFAVSLRLKTTLNFCPLDDTTTHPTMNRSHTIQCRLRFQTITVKSAFLKLFAHWDLCPFSPPFLCAVCLIWQFLTIRFMCSYSNSALSSSVRQLYEMVSHYHWHPGTSSQHLSSTPSG